MHTYSQSIDGNAEDEFVDCWTDDATLHWSAEPRVGRPAIAEAFRAHMHPPDVLSKHVTLEARIAVDGDRATASSYLAFIDDGDFGPRIRSYGRYADRFVRCDNGRWRFQERRPIIEAKRP